MLIYTLLRNRSNINDAEQLTTLVLINKINGGGQLFFDKIMKVNS